MSCYWRSGAVALAFATAFAAFPFSVAAEDANSWDQRGFLGLWEGVDRLDGSTVRVSISDVDYDDVLEIVWGESFFTGCFEVGAGFSLGRGVFTGEGTFVHSEELAVEAILTCINDVDEPEEQEEEQDPVKFSFVLEGRVLVIRGSGEFPDILLHRVAR